MPNCGRVSGFKRALGVGTVLMAVLTGGLWLLAIPFYPVRCTHCGLPRGEALAGTGEAAGLGTRMVWSWICGAGILLVLAAAVSAMRGPWPPRPTSMAVEHDADVVPNLKAKPAPAKPTRPAAAEPAIPVYAADLYADYRRNEINADARYKGKMLAVAAVVSAIRKDYLDRPRLDLAVWGDRSAVQAALQDAAMRDAAALEPGATVRLLCRGDGMTIGTPMLRDCLIVKPKEATEATAPERTSAGDAAAQPTQVERSATPEDAPGRYRNPRFGFEFTYPAGFGQPEVEADKLAATVRSANGEVSIVALGSMAEDHTVAEALDKELRLIHAVPNYQAKGKTWLVLSWNENGRAIYLKRFVGAGAQNTLIVSFPEGKVPEYSDLVTMVEKSFRPGDLSQAH